MLILIINCYLFNKIDVFIYYRGLDDEEETLA